MALTEPSPSASRWVVWGSGDPVPSGFFDQEAPDDAALLVVAERDPDHDLTDGWAVVLSATEIELDNWARAAGSVCGYAPYEQLAEPPDQRRKVEGPRPY